MSPSRREILKAQAAGVAALAANISLPATAQPVAGGVEALKIQWSKAPCRFCGTGCGVMVGVKEGASSPPMATCSPRSIAASTA